MQEFLVGYIFGMVSVFTLGIYIKYGKLFTDIESEKEINKVEKLKNGLLTYSLIKINQKDFNDNNINNILFTGKYLPKLDGSSIENSCINYINNKDLMKYKAINLYLDSHFTTEEEIINFLTKFINKDKIT